MSYNISYTREIRVRKDQVVPCFGYLRKVKPLPVFSHRYLGVDLDFQILGQSGIFIVFSGEPDEAIGREIYLRGFFSVNVDDATILGSPEVMKIKEI